MRTAENLSVSEDPGGITPIKLRDTVILRAAYGNVPRSARKSSGTRKHSATHTAIIRRNHPRGRPGTAADPTPASSLHKNRTLGPLLSLGCDFQVHWGSQGRPARPLLAVASLAWW